MIRSSRGAFASTGNDRLDLLNSLKAAINELNTPLPANFNSLCTNVITNVNTDIQQTDVNGIDALLARWALPQQITDFLRNIKWSEDVRYQTYKFAIQKGESRLQEFVASGKNNKGRILLSFIRVDVSGQATQQYVVTRSCKRTLFKKKCHDVYNPRGFYTEELIAIQNGLLHHGYNRLQREAGIMLTDAHEFNNILLGETRENHIALQDVQNESWLERAIRDTFKALKE